MSNIERLTAGIFAAAITDRGGDLDGRYFENYDFLLALGATADRIGLILNQASYKFASKALRSSIVLNSIPKSGTHLLHNILAMFVRPEEQFSDEFILLENWERVSQFFRADAPPRLYVGHLNFRKDVAEQLAGAKMPILVRDPYDYVLSYVRYLMSPSLEAPIAEWIRDQQLPYEAVVPIVILGNYHERYYFAGINLVYTENAVNWLSAGRKLVRYEELLRQISRLETPEAETYFTELLAGCGIRELPPDWRKRVAFASDRRLSRTSRDYVRPYAEVPSELSEAHKNMVELAAPGLRRLLGYE